jgi:hypothetical protein
VSAFEDSLCDLCDIPKAYCIHGNAEAAKEDRAARRGYSAADLIPDGPTIVATQTHPCPAGDGNVEPGDSITHTEDGWAHTSCTLRPSAPPTTDTSMFEGI